MVKPFWGSQTVIGATCYSHQDVVWVVIEQMSITELMYDKSLGLIK